MEEQNVVQMTCMTTKKKFDVTDPEVVKLRNGRYAYRAMCPWKGKHDRVLYAYKFCSSAAYDRCMRDIQEEEELPSPLKPLPESEQALD